MTPFSYTPRMLKLRAHKLEVEASDRGGVPREGVGHLREQAAECRAAARILEAINEAGLTR